jgi:Fanconi anemia group M protein
VQGKVVFVAPTRPLVAQQVSACERFMGLGAGQVAELTGGTSAERRKEVWRRPEVRAVFCTPQTLWNDVKRGACPYDAVSCLVVDECHRATGAADVVSVLRFMRAEKRLKFRVLGLSATPGASAEQVQEVLANLGAAAVEFRAEGDEDVRAHVHPRRVVTHVVAAAGGAAGGGPLPPLLSSLQQALGHLSTTGAYFGSLDCERVRRFELFAAQRDAALPQGAAANRWFAQATQLVNLRDTLEAYGAEAALQYLNAKLAERSALRGLAEASPVFAMCVQALGKASSEGTSAAKMQKLVEVLRAHFEGAAAAGGGGGGGGDAPAGRVIVFTNLREGVASITRALAQHAPLIAARAFVGQGGAAAGGWSRAGGAGSGGGAGMKQKEQKAVLEGFRKGEFNVLVATCIGEEGLDIPAVDLIVCYDATASPTRAVQREGRTGRHRQGSVVYILSAGKEEEAFNRIAESTAALHAKLRAADRHFELAARSPRMLPRRFTPERLDVEVAQHAEQGGRSGGAGSGRGRGSKGRGRGRGRGAAAVEPVAEAAGEFQALTTAAAGGRGRGRGRSAGSGSRGRGRAGAAAAGPLRRKIAPIVFEDDGVDLEEEDDDLLGGGGAGGGGGRGLAAAAGPPPPDGEEGAVRAGTPPQEEAAGPTRALLFPRSTSVIRWSQQRRLSVAAPPPLAVLLLLGGQPGAAQPAQHAAALLEDGALELPGGRVLRRGDSSLHRWAFLAAAGAQPKPPPASDAAAPAAAVQASAKPAGRVSKPRKRKPVAPPPPPQQQPPPPPPPVAPAAPEAPVAAAPAALAAPQPPSEPPRPAPLHEPAPAAAEVVDLTFDSQPECEPAAQQAAAPAAVANEAVPLSQQPLAARLQHRQARAPPAPAPKPPAAAAEDMPLAKRLKVLREAAAATGGASPSPPAPAARGVDENRAPAPPPAQAPLPAALPPASPPASQHPRYSQPPGAGDDQGWGGSQGLDDLGGGGGEEFSLVGAGAGINHDFYGVDDDGDEGWGDPQLASSPPPPAPPPPQGPGSAQEVGGWGRGRGRGALRRVILDSPGSTPALSRQQRAAGEGPAARHTTKRNMSLLFGCPPLCSPDPASCSAPRLAESPASGPLAGAAPASAPRPSRPNRLRKGSSAAPAAAAPPPRPPRPGGNPPPPKRFRTAQFLDVEAQLSGEGSGDDEDEEGVDAFEADFIDDGTQAPSSSAGDGHAGPASLAAFHHRRLLDDRASPSPAELLRRMGRRRMGCAPPEHRTPPGGSGAHAAGAPSQEDAYDEDDSFIDDDGDDDFASAGGGASRNEDFCVACADTLGLLVCCDGCPAAYHLACAGLSAVPPGEWFCRACGPRR